MTMTKRHFQLFAEACSKIVDNQTRERVITFLVPVFRESNPRFNENTFREWIERRLNNQDLKGLRPNPKYVLN